MPGSEPQTLYMLALDHRGSFGRLHQAAVPDWEARSDEDRVASMRGAKRIVFEALLDAVGEDHGGVAHPAVLVDERLGGEVAGAAREHDIPLAMAVEKSSQDVFEFEYGDDFGEHLSRYDADYAKALVRYNPGGDADGNRTQSERLRRLSDWCADHGPDLLLEVLVPPEEHQLAEVAGDEDAYDRQLRPELMRQAIAQLQDAGVRAPLWKIEGVDTAKDAAMLAEQAQAVDERSRCLILGRGADAERVDHWLRQAAPHPGYAGFAIGRTVFADALSAHLAGDIDRPATVQRIAEQYRHFVATYEQAAG